MSSGPVETHRWMSIFGCAGCGGDHRLIHASRMNFDVEVQGEKTREAFLCPDTARPVFVLIDDTATMETTP